MLAVCHCTIFGLILQFLYLDFPEYIRLYVAIIQTEGLKLTFLIHMMFSDAQPTISVL